MLLAVFWKGFRTSLRILARQPWLTVANTATVALGIGANASLVGLLKDVVAPASPYEAEQRLVVLENTGRYNRGDPATSLPAAEVSYPDFSDWVERATLMARIDALAQGEPAVVGGLDRLRAICRVFVTGGLLEVLGTRAQLGRTLTAEDFVAGSPHVAVLTHGLWRARFGSDPGVAGRPIRISGQPFTIAGVLPPGTLGFLAQRRGILEPMGLEECIVTPLVPGGAGTDEGLFRFLQERRDLPWLRVVGRLQEGVGLPAAQAEMAAIAGQLAAENPASNRGRSVRVSALGRWRNAEIRPVLALSLVTAALLLLVTLSTVATLALTDGIRRGPESAIHLALGGSRRVLAALVMGRCLAWSLPGCLLAPVVGWAVASLAGRNVVFARLPHVSSWPADLGIALGVTLTLAVAVTAGSLAGCRLGRRNLSDDLREGAFTSLYRRRAAGLEALASVQVGAVLATCFAAALLVHSLWRIAAVDLGFEPRNAVSVQVRLPPSRYPKPAERLMFYERLLARLRALPGIQGACVTAAVPLSGTGVSLGGFVAWEPQSGRTTSIPRLDAHFMTPTCIEALGLRMSRGAAPLVDRGSIPQALVDDAFVRRYSPDRDVLSSALRFGLESFEIVGVVGDVQQFQPDDAPSPTVYLPLSAAEELPWVFVVVRTWADPSAVGQQLLTVIQAAEPEACIDDPTRLQDYLLAALEPRREIAVLISVSGVILFLLTALSLMVALDRYVASHSRELTIRLALGATRGRTLNLVIRQLGRTLLVGVLLGAAAARRSLV